MRSFQGNLEMPEANSIRTSYWAKPIPLRQFDWEAALDGYDGAPDASGPQTMIGHGATEEEAVADLTEQLAEWEEEEPDTLPSMPLAELERVRIAAAKEHALQREMDAAFGPSDPNYVPF